MQKMTSDEYRERLEALFMRVTNAPDGRGAITWAANALPWDRSTITRWLTEDVMPERAVVALHGLEHRFET